jgi:hypothetical protein
VGQSGVVHFYLALPFRVTRFATDPLVDALLPRKVEVVPSATALERASQVVKSASSSWLVRLGFRNPPPAPPPPTPFALFLDASRARYADLTNALASTWRSMALNDELRDRILCILLGYVCIACLLSLMYKWPQRFGERAARQISRIFLVGKVRRLVTLSMQGW